MCVCFLSIQVVYKTNDDHVTVIGAGVTVHEALAAAEQLKKGTTQSEITIYCFKDLFQTSGSAGFNGNPVSSSSFREN